MFGLSNRFAARVTAIQRKVAPVISEVGGSRSASTVPSALIIVSVRMS